MLIVGAKGFATEVLEVVNQSGEIENLVFYDDINKNLPQKLYETFPIIKDLKKAEMYFKSIDNRFTIGIGNPSIRKRLYEKFISIGGVFTSTISPRAIIGSFGNSIGFGCNIMSGTVVTNDIKIEKGVLINLNCTIGHGCNIKQFVEICPGVNISGNCTVGEFTFIGTGATILPRIIVGTNVILAAGTVVTKDVTDNCMVAGIPGVIKKQLPKLLFQ